MQESVLPRWIFSFAKKDDAPPPVPEDLTPLSDTELADLESRLGTEFDELHAGIADAPVAERPTMLARMEELGTDIERVSAESTKREAEATETLQQADELAARVRGTNDEAEAEEAPAEVVAPAQVAATAEETVAASEETTETTAETVTAAAKIPAQPRRRPKLNDIRAQRNREPKPEARSGVTITAAADIPELPMGAEMDDINDIAQAMWRKGRHLGDRSGNVPIATIRREFEHTIGKETSLARQLEIADEAASVLSLVASGGWCAPSEILYELFNIAEASGMLDLPTVGITRGGIQFVNNSPTLADVLSDVWTWTEQNDIDAAASGTGGPTKPCVTIPCPTFTNKRLDGRGICITAGNLTDRAYPETTENFVRLLIAAHAHVLNKAHVDAVVAGSTAVAYGGPATGAAANLLDGVALSAVDYRAKFGMGIDAVLEVVMPDWVEDLIRSDLARRRGVSMMSVGDAEIGGWFDDRGVRLQLINDYQVRAAGKPGVNGAAITDWPTSVEFLLYAAGTWLKGNGPTIDLGVVRDSTLNKTNDYTAAWSEEFTLIAKRGHESRKVTVSVCPDGTTGGDATTPCA